MYQAIFASLSKPIMAYIASAKTFHKNQNGNLDISKGANNAIKWVRQKMSSDQGCTKT